MLPFAGRDAARRRGQPSHVALSAIGERGAGPQRPLSQRRVCFRACRAGVWAFLPPAPPQGQWRLTCFSFRDCTTRSMMSLSSDVESACAFSLKSAPSCSLLLSSVALSSSGLDCPTFTACGAPWPVRSIAHARTHAPLAEPAPGRRTAPAFPAPGGVGRRVRAPHIAPHGAPRRRLSAAAPPKRHAAAQPTRQRQTPRRGRGAGVDLVRARSAAAGHTSHAPQHRQHTLPHQPRTVHERQRCSLPQKRPRPPTPPHPSTPTRRHRWAARRFRVWPRKEWRRACQVITHARLQEVHNPTGAAYACAAAPRSLQTLARAGSLKTSHDRSLQTLGQTHFFLTTGARSFVAPVRRSAFSAGHSGPKRQSINPRAFW